MVILLGKIELGKYPNSIGFFVSQIPTITRTVACTLHGYGLWPALRHALLILESRWSREYAIYRADKERNDRIR